MDPELRVLLFRFRISDGVLAGHDCWATPGGAVEEGETFEQAAIRELREETGMVVDSVSPHVGEREFVLQLASGEHVRAEERFFLIWSPDTVISRAGWSAHEAEVMTDHRWWTVEALAQTTETVWPSDLLAMLSTAIRSR